MKVKKNIKKLSIYTLFEIWSKATTIDVKHVNSLMCTFTITFVILIKSVFFMFYTHYSWEWFVVSVFTTFFIDWRYGNENFDNIVKIGNILLHLETTQEHETLADYIEGWQIKLWNHASSNYFKRYNYVKKFDAFKDFKASNKHIFKM
jgi:hypothetical protein